jgi:hypothetical protein
MDITGTITAVYSNPQIYKQWLDKQQIINLDNKKLLHKLLIKNVTYELRFRKTKHKLTA